MKKKVIIYTDGSCINNPGPGGIGVIMTYGTKLKEFSRGYKKTTNNRMELMAVIEALKALKTGDLDVEVVSDSSYVVDAINKGWVFQWVKKDFKNKKNPDLWLKLLDLFHKNNITFKWVEGHAGHTENERCDFLARNAAMNPTEIDYGYINTGLY